MNDLPYVCETAEELQEYIESMERELRLYKKRYEESGGVISADPETIELTKRELERYKQIHKERFGERE
jgi:multidrug resistance efflux pump